MLRGTQSTAILSEGDTHTHTLGVGEEGVEGEINSSSGVWIITVVSKERRAAIVASPLRVSYHSLACHYSFKCCCSKVAMFGVCMCVFASHLLLFVHLFYSSWYLISSYLYLTLSHPSFYISTWPLPFLFFFFLPLSSPFLTSPACFFTLLALVIVSPLDFCLPSVCFIIWPLTLPLLPSVSLSNPLPSSPNNHSLFLHSHTLSSVFVQMSGSSVQFWEDSPWLLLSVLLAACLSNKLDHLESRVVFVFLPCFYFLIWNDKVS